MLYETGIKKFDGSFHKLIFDSETRKLMNTDGTLYRFDTPQKRSKIVVKVPDRIMTLVESAFA
jgi:hypothetical protein